jgi:hypothetical protein
MTEPNAPFPEPSSYDAIRAWAEGTLGPEDVRRLEAAFAADPDLRFAAEEYRAVHRMTGGLPAEAPVSRVTFDDVARELGLPEDGAPAATTRWVRWSLAAAALLLLSLGALWALRERRPDAPDAPAALELSSLPADAAGAPAAPDVPAHLAGWRPVADGKIQWLTSREEARAVAARTGRPVLVYVFHESCPYCVEMDETTLRDRVVVEAAGGFVPLHVDVMRLPREEGMALFRKGWPYFAVERADGVEVASFPGRHDGAEFRERLEAALAGATGAALPWERVDAAAARAAIVAARERAATDPEAARRGLETFATRLPAGPVADDVSLVLARWRAEGRFPDLRFAGAP